MSLPNHGANPHHLADALGVTLPKKYIDFSENTNPYGPPSSLVDIYQKEAITTIPAYPDPHVTALTERLAQRNNLLAEQILVGNGAAELIFLIASTFRGKRVRIVEPAFSEYRDACEAYGCEVQSFILEEPWEFKDHHIKDAIKDIDLLFLCSPNNPTGIHYDEANMIKLLEEAKKENVYVVIDEAFYDFSHNIEGLHRLSSIHSNLIILRSLTKMYAIAGLRLGYVLAKKEMIERLKVIQPPWSVNGLAQNIGLALIDDESFVRESISHLQSERKRMKSELEKLQFNVSSSTVNFYLLSEREKNDSKALFLFLLQHGIVARHTYNFRGLEGKYIRLAVKDYDSNEKLLQVLKMWRSHV